MTKKHARKKNPSPEAMAFARDLRSGQITPAAVERRTRQLRDELDDAIYFKHPDAAVDSLRSQVRDMEEVLKGGWPQPEGPTAKRERLEQEAFARAAATEGLAARAEKLAKEIERLQEDLHESVRLRDPEREIKALRETIASKQAELIELTSARDVALRGLTDMAEAAQAELGPRGPVPMSPKAMAAEEARQRAAVALRQAQVRLASLRSELEDAGRRHDGVLVQRVRREIREAEEDVDVLQGRASG